MVEYRFETPEGVALTCADLGAAMLEVTLFERDNDVLPYDRQHVPCEVSAEGVGVVAWRVEALPYARLVVRVVGQGGGTVRVCVEGRTEEATTLISPCIVTQGAPSQQEWTLRAQPGGCV